MAVGWRNDEVKAGVELAGGEVRYSAEEIFGGVGQASPLSNQPGSLMSLALGIVVVSLYPRSSTVSVALYLRTPLLGVA